MRCDAFQERLNNVLDDRESPLADAELTQHAATCATCDATLQMSSSLIDAFQLAFVPALEPSHDVAAAGSVETAPPVTSWRSSALSRSLLATGAMLLLAASFNWLGSNPTSEPSAPVANVGEVSETLVVMVAPPVQSPPSLPALALTAEPLIQTSTTFVHQPIISLGLLSTADWNYSVNEVNMPFGARLAVEPRWIEAVADGMVPVQQSMSKTLAAIRKSLSS